MSTVRPGCFDLLLRFGNRFVSYFSKAQTRSGSKTWSSLGTFWDFKHVYTRRVTYVVIYVGYSSTIHSIRQHSI